MLGKPIELVKPNLVSKISSFTLHSLRSIRCQYTLIFSHNATYKQCSRTCGKGVRRRKVLCTEEVSGRVVSPVRCAELGKGKPKVVENCRAAHCPLQWIANEWSQVRNVACSLSSLLQLIFTCSNAQKCTYEETIKGTKWKSDLRWFFVNNKVVGVLYILVFKCIN